jgi:hypothetical protein
MKASFEQLAALRLVARRLGTLRDEVVFVGGMTTGLLVTNPGSPMARPTHDVDVILEVASTIQYQTKLRKRLRACGFREATGEGAPLCRWLLEGIAVDVMPTAAGVLGFSNRWYAHALASAQSTALPPDEDGVVSIRVIAAPAFLATKLVGWKSRGNGDLLHHDIEDIVSVVDGRPPLLTEVESETPELRKFLAASVASLFRAGLEEQIPSHLPGDSASQARFPSVLTTFRRIERCPRLLKLGEKVTARSNGDPGATNVSGDASWDWEIRAIENAVASKPSTGNSHVAVVARLTSHSMTAGTTGDGRAVLIEDSAGRHFRPLWKLLHGERAQRKMLDPCDQILPREPFDTVWVYELPATANDLRLLLPFANVELPFERLLF